MTEDDRVQRARNRYEAAMHAMQSAVAWRLQRELGEHASQHVIRVLKHMRVGVNSTMVESGILAMLLVRKGIITEAEYYEALANGAEREAAMAAAEAKKAGDLPDNVRFG